MIRYAGGSGFTQRDAIEIIGAENESEGLEAENEYLKSHFEQWKLLTKVFYIHSGRKFDIIEMGNSRRSKKIIWFDISDFFGK